MTDTEILIEVAKEIPLIGSSKVAFVDAADFELVSKHQWCLTVSKDKHEYALSTINGVRYYMHKLILPNAVLVDHKDGNGLNNRRSNIRESNYQLNAANRRKPRTGLSSKYKGVHFDKARKKFVAMIKVNDVSKNLGGYIVEEDAAKAYDKDARLYFGEHALTNFPL